MAQSLNFHRLTSDDDGPKQRQQQQQSTVEGEEVESLVDPAGEHQSSSSPSLIGKNPHRLEGKDHLARENGTTMDHLNKQSPRSIRSGGAGASNDDVEEEEEGNQRGPPSTSPAKKLQEATESAECANNKSFNQDDGDDGADRRVETNRTKPPPLKIMEFNNANAQSQSDSAPKTPLTPGPSSADFAKKRQMDKERKIGHRRVDEEGQVTYKKIQTSQIMGSIQLGIGHAVGSLASKPERDLLMKDFMELETVAFTKEGSSTTPAHHYSDFKFKIYAPIAFRYFRDLFGIQPDDFLLSLCNEPLRELSNPGASGSVFYLTTDDNFIIKTVQHKEAEFLLKLLPGYYMNLNQNPRTLLPKFFGQYCYICGGKNVRIIVMNNLLPSYVKMHQKYDLKGSTYKRKANKYERKKESPTFKDLDFMEHHPEGIYLESETYHALIKTMNRDCRVLESFKIMDYSLLVGIHNLDQASREREERQREQANHLAELAAQELSQNSDPQGNDQANYDSKLLRTRSTNKQRIAAFSTALESIQADIDPIDQEDDVPPGGIPARNEQGERLLLYVGIIDILQSYRFKKKLEHTWKSMLHDGDTISVHRPNFYAQRFLDFMSKTVFKKITSRSGSGPAKANKASAPHVAQQRYPLDNSRYLRTAVIKQAASKQSVILENHASAENNELSVNSSCASSLTSSGLGSTLRTVTWTPPHSSIGTITPSHTEGTPSLTESSESEFCPNTPLRSRSSTRYSRSTLAEEEAGDAEVVCTIIGR